MCATRTGSHRHAAREHLDGTCINTIRTLSMDAVQAANSGHPGAPMAMAPVAYCLWQQFLRFDPQDPIWPNRDRFVLSAGHASMLLYSLLHLTGVKAVSKDTRRSASRRCRWRRSSASGSSTAGAPATRSTAGPAASRPPPARSARGWPTASAWPSPGGGWPPSSTGPASRLFDFNVYALCGDGCIMEGISAEAASLAGHLKLSNLCWIYDNNHITIEGNTELAFSEDVATRFLGHGWNVTRVGDANDLEMLGAGLPHVPGHARPADADHRRQPHRLRRPEQAGHQRRPRRAARRGGNPADQAELRLAGGRQVPGPRRRLRALPERHRQARQGAARRLVRAL